jgi:hypothetical protein
MRGSLLFILIFSLISCKKVDCLKFDNVKGEIKEFYIDDFYVNDYEIKEKYRYAVLRTQAELDSFNKAKKGTPRQVDMNVNSILLFTGSGCSPESYKVDLQKDNNLKSYNYYYTHYNCDCSSEWIQHHILIAVVNKLEDNYDVKFIESY